MTGVPRSAWCAPPPAPDPRRGAGVRWCQPPASPRSPRGSGGQGGAGHHRGSPVNDRTSAVVALDGPAWPLKGQAPATKPASTGSGHARGLPPSSRSLTGRPNIRGEPADAGVGARARGFRRRAGEATNTRWTGGAPPLTWRNRMRVGAVGPHARGGAAFQPASECWPDAVATVHSAESIWARWRWPEKST